MTNPFTFLLILLFIPVASFSQDLNFSIQYPVDVDFSGSGLEKNQIIELENGNLVMYRFTYDTISSEHNIHLWSCEPTAFVIWSKEFSIGIGDSVPLKADLCADGNNFLMVFPTVLGYGNTTASVVKFDADGEPLGQTASINIPNAIQARELTIIRAENEYYVAGIAVYPDNSRDGFLTRSVNGSFAAAETKIIPELTYVNTMYIGDDNKLQLVGRIEHEDADLTVNFPTEAIGTKFPEEIRILEAIYDSVHGTYYSGAIGQIQLTNENAILIHRDLQNNLTGTELYTTGPMFHGSFATDLAFIDDGVAIIGYGSVPHPITFLSKFDYNLNLELSREFGIYQPFNYNRTNLLAHSNGTLYYSVLGGIFNSSGSAFTTVFNCLNDNYQTSCDGDVINSVYNTLPVTETPDTVAFVPSGSISLSAFEIHPIAFIDSIPCASNLETEDFVVEQTQLYPNPFHSATTLKFNETVSLQHLNIECTDNLGRTIPFTMDPVTDREFQLHFPEEFKGMVFIRVKSGVKEMTVVGVLE